MIDLIRDTLTFDFGYINSGALDSAGPSVDRASSEKQQ